MYVCIIIRYAVYNRFAPDLSSQNEQAPPGLDHAVMSCTVSGSDVANDTSYALTNPMNRTQGL